MATSNENDPPYFLRSQSTDGTINANQARALLLTHSSTSPTLSRTTSLVVSNSLVRSNFHRRTIEGARQLRDNLHNVIREIQPLMENARTARISDFLNRPQSEPNIQHSGVGQSGTSSSSFVINVEQPVQASTSAEPTNQNNLEIADEESGNANDGNVANNNENEDNSDNLESQQALSTIQKYIPFILILIAKCIYDHQEGLANVIVLFAIFVHSNSVVKKEATKRNRRNKTKLLLAIVYIVIGVLFIHYLFDDEKLYLNLVFIRTYEKPLTVWDLLWFVGITDFILKLITVTVKLILTMLPGAAVPFQKRGKIYLFIEAISQLYRGLAPIQPWLYYLLESYQGTEKIVGVFLSSAYMVSKGADLMSKFKLLKMAIFKLIQNVTVGCSPSKEQIQTAGDHCPICHDEYESPVLLQCRHIFCESCVTTWFDREQTCPLCRSKIVDDPSWRDGSTTFFIQMF